jgi:RNA recognition motif-containing protein
VKKKNCGRTRGLKTFGFVGFTDANNAKKALENFNGYELEGRRIRVEFARPHPATLRFNLQKQACHDNPAPSSTGVDGVDSDGDDGSDDSDSNDDNGDDDDDDDDSGDDSQHINSSISQPSVCDHRGYCAHFRGVRTARFLVDLYLLADKLKDPVSANMATDEIINLNEFDLALSELLVDFISTPRHVIVRFASSPATGTSTKLTMIGSTFSTRRSGTRSSSTTWSTKSRLSERTTPTSLSASCTTSITWLA